MTRLVWGALAERFYETGVDRGVLYSEDSTGVAWSGLVSVSETPTGGGPNPFYLDGIKYVNIASAEEFAATISAINAPAEFNICDGVASVHNGLFATQQPRVPFGLSYRSRVGNAIDGDNHGYKIHLVYNALAMPSQRSRQTLSNSGDLTSLSWQISTLPPAITGFKRTAHLIIDSRYTDPGVLSDVEDILYGTISETAMLPTPDELIALFA